MTNEVTKMTSRIAAFVVDTNAREIPNTIYEHAKVALMDWLGVAIAGKEEPLVNKLIQYTDCLGGKEQATILGHGVKKTVCQAALINGAASHALDYDDSMIAFLGHPSVTLFPSILSLSEWQGKNGADFLTAYIIGLKAGTTVAKCAGMGHYGVGWHGTSTMGHLASAAACSRLLGLDVQQTTYALGIAGTQASGLRQVFGTMCKPFHAGRASEVGLMASLLAQNGFTSAEDILEGQVGLFKTMKGEVDKDVLDTLGKTWEIEGLAQKYHASCHATHSPMEAAMSIVKHHGLSIDEIKSIKIKASEMALSAAFRTEASTGLEGKFCIPYCVANALVRGDTGTQAFQDDRVADPEVRELMKKISIRSYPEVQAMEAEVDVEKESGVIYSAFSDVIHEIPELEVKRSKIEKKFLDLCIPVLGDQKARQLVESLSGMEKINDMKSFVELM